MTPILILRHYLEEAAEVGDLREAVRSFARERVAPLVAALDLEERFPADVYKEMAGLGMLGITVPTSDGGLGATAAAYAAVMEEFAVGYASIADQVGLVEIVGSLLAAHGTSWQRRRYLGPTLRAELWCAYALTEPDAGSDLAGIRTRARRCSGGWRLGGEKVFIHNAPVADYAVVLALTGDGDPRRGMSAFLVDLEGEGVLRNRREHKMGQCASQVGSLVFDDAPLLDTALLGEEGCAFDYMKTVLAKGRLGIASLALGISRAALAVATSYAAARQQFGGPILHKQSIAFSLADMVTEHRAAQLLVASAARSLDEGRPDAAVACSMAKLYASESCVRHSGTAVQICGGSGYIRGNEAERLYRDARVTTIYEGTSEIQRLIISRAVAREV